MNKRGQAALEYLMTYGWALIVIAIVVGVLVFIVSSPGGPQCQSADPARVVLKTQNLSRTDTTSRILLQNITGGDIVINSMVPDTGATGFQRLAASAKSTGNFIQASSTGMAISVSAGGNIELKPDYDLAAPTSLTNATYDLGYTDAFQLPKKVTITCNGNLPA